MPRERSHLDLGERMAVLEQVVANHGEELARRRERLHKLESSAEAVRMLTESLPGQLEELAHRAAADALELALEHRDELARAQRGEHRSTLVVALQIVGSVVGAVGVVAAIVEAVIR